jgi:hypothetical protein
MLYTYRLIGWLTPIELDKMIKKISTSTICYEKKIQIKIPDYINIDEIEEFWNLHRGLVFEFQYGNSWNNYYLMLPKPLPDNNLIYKLVKDMNHNVFEPQLSVYMCILNRRMKQRLFTRVRIDELTKIANQKALEENTSCYYEYLLTMLLEECERIPKGEDIFWFEEKERNVFEQKIEETRIKIEECYRPGNIGCKEAEKHFYSISKI